ncbi:MAG: 16S rRNA (guanine(966)-N(2))-methyltransferase RsmD [Bacillota bacterium]
MADEGDPMRIIAGSKKGMKLKTPGGTSVRPTANRVREALFNILGPLVRDAVFIDLYAGSGAVGIEALSRGARLAIFVENKRDNIPLIGENLKKSGFKDRSLLLHRDVNRALPHLAEKQFRADLIFMDPPYLSKEIPTVIKAINGLPLLSPDGLIIVEHACSNGEWAAVFSNLRRKKYGQTCLSIIKP